MTRRDKTWLFETYEDLWSPQLPLDRGPRLAWPRDVDTQGGFELPASGYWRHLE